MFMLTGRIAGKLIKVADQACWKNVELLGCVIVGGPSVRFQSFDTVAFTNCVFLYDGMEVEGAEWLAFMSMEKMPARAARRQR